MLFYKFVDVIFSLFQIMKKVLLVFISSILTSCGILINNIESSDLTYLSIEIIQTISKTEALAWTNDSKVVKLETTSEIYYDGKEIYGNFILVGTYNYITKKGIIKTVPVYVRTTEYKKRINKNI